MAEVRTPFGVKQLSNPFRCLTSTRLVPVKSDPKPNHCELLLMRVNEMDGVPSCDLCTETFSSKDEYLNHVIPAHRDQEAYVCHPCKRVKTPAATPANG